MRDDVVEAGEVADEEGLSILAISVKAAVRHRPSAAHLIVRIDNFVAKPLEQIERCSSDLWKESIDVTVNESPMGMS